jgi:hypothetical protein
MKSIPHLLILLLISFLWKGTLLAQIKTNLEIFYSLADSSVTQFVAYSKPPTKIRVQLNNGDAYSVFNNQILGSLKTNGIEIVKDKEDSLPLFSYSIENAITQYTQIFRNGFLGAFMVNREITFKGNYFYSGTGKKDFSYKYQDTVKVDDIKNLENTTSPFTNGALPPEPFFTGLFEPVVALGTAAAAIVLFFTVRSK